MRMQLKKMALFRRLSHFSKAGKGLLFLTLSEAATVPYSEIQLRRCFSAGIGLVQQRLASNICILRLTKSSIASTVLLPGQCRHVFTQTGGTLAASRKEKQPSTGGTRSGGKHESVLQELMSVKEQDQPKQLTLGAKVVQASKDFTYLLVVLGSFAVAGFLLWSVGSEFFSSNSPQSIYTKALKRVKQDPQVVEALGLPISGHGELAGRGRRRKPLNQEYIVDGVSYMRMKFYVDGSKRKGTVLLDMKKNGQGKYQCRFLFVELKGYPPVTIVLEDNR